MSDGVDLKLLIPKVLQSNGISDEIEEVFVSKPDLKGEHMLSDIETVEVRFRQQEPKYLFVKKRLKFPHNTGKDNRMKLIMRKEGQFLTRIVDDLNEICKETRVNLLQDLFPTVYHCDEDLIVMEDLSKRGYHLLSKTDRLNFEQLSSVVEALARFHAVSYVYLERSGGVENFLKKHPDFEPNLPKPDGKIMMKMVFEPIYEKTLLMLKLSTTPQSREAYKVLKPFSGKLGDTLAEVVESETLFHVLCHGDLWTNNIMFHSNDKELVFVDFQIVQVGSPNLDLGCLLFTSGQRDARLRWQELLRIYMKHFEGSLRKLGQSFTFSMEDFVEDYRRKCKLGFFFGVFTAVVFEAIEGEDVTATAKDPQALTELMANWMKEHPVKAEEMCQFLVDVVEELSQVAGSSALTIKAD